MNIIISSILLGLFSNLFSAVSGLLTKKIILKLSLVATLVSACAAPLSQFSTQTPYPTYTPYPSQTPWPTYTPFPTLTPLPSLTPVPTISPISEFSIDDYIFQEGDLPEEYTFRQLNTTPPPIYDDLLKAEKISFHQIALDSKDIGSIAVFLYETETEAQTAYEARVTSVAGNFVMSYEDGDLGDISRVTWFDFAIVTSGGVKYVDLSFRSCNMVVSIVITGDSNTMEQYKAYVNTYAENLESRLSPLICEYLNN